MSARGGDTCKKIDCPLCGQPILNIKRAAHLGECPQR